MRRIGSVLTLAAVLSLLCGLDRAYATELTFAGNAVGCFNCTSTSLSALPTTVGGLTFDGGTLSVNPDQTVGLGTFTLELSQYNYSSNHTSFLLGVTFTAPAAIDGAYTAEVEGSINRRQNGAVNIQLDPAFHHFSFDTAAGFGSFDFGMYASTLLLRPDDASVALLGVIRNLEFTPNVSEPVVTENAGAANAPVPEPTSLVLLALGGATACVRRRAGGRRAAP